MASFLLQSILIIEVAYNCSAPRTFTGKITKLWKTKVRENPNHGREKILKICVNIWPIFPRFPQAWQNSMQGTSQGAEGGQQLVLSMSGCPLLLPP